MNRGIVRFVYLRPSFSILVFPLLACWSLFGQGQIDGSEYPSTTRPPVQSVGNGWPRADRALQADDPSGQPPLSGQENPEMSGEGTVPSRPFNNERSPDQLVLKPGTFITVRVNQTLSSDN